MLYQQLEMNAMMMWFAFLVDEDGLDKGRIAANMPRRQS
jgi:hypothetical protein